jgi:alpha-beta hydrolase superfamily lysophospholipase
MVAGPAAPACRVGDDLAMTVAARLAAGAGVGIGAGLGGIGWFYSGVLLDTRRQMVYPERVQAVSGDTVTLADSRLARQPGTWGLRWDGGLARVGPVSAVSSGSVRRPLIGGDRPAPDTSAVLDTGPWDPDPAARGLHFVDVDVPTPLGPAPAWFVPGPTDRPGRDTWVIAVHGRGGSRREALRVLPALHGLGLPVLVISYRNDGDAPASPDGRDHLGDAEWEDVTAAVRFARGRGARRIVLYGWSMGGAITGQFLDRAPDASLVDAVVWDAPLVDWRATLRLQARNRRLPPGLTPLATAITSRRIRIDFDRFDLRRRPPAVRPPTLVVHTDCDTVVPVAASRALAAAAPSLGWSLRYVEVAELEHTAAWNADPAAYEETVTSFLTEVLAPWTP